MKILAQLVFLPRFKRIHQIVRKLRCGRIRHAAPPTPPPPPIQRSAKKEPDLDGVKECVFVLTL